MISLIVAVAENNCIGTENKLPWRLSADLKRFKKITTGHTVIMGRKTYESILQQLGKPLPDRRNIIISNQKDYKAHECEVMDWPSALNAFENSNEEVFIIGGAEIYKTALSYAKKIYLTLVHTQPEGDAFFPELNKLEWKINTVEKTKKDEKNEYETTYTIYERFN